MSKLNFHHALLAMNLVRNKVSQAAMEAEAMSEDNLEKKAEQMRMLVMETQLREAEAARKIWE